MTLYTQRQQARSEGDGESTDFCLERKSTIASFRSGISGVRVVAQQRGHHGLAWYEMNRARLLRHSRAYGNLAIGKIRHSRQNQDVDPLRGHCLIAWIPAGAGMTT